MDPLISVVSPVYKAELIIDELVKRLTEQISGITEHYEIILVDDCGPDNSWGKIMEHCARDSRVKGIKLSRNFGQHPAITAGLDSCRGEWVVVMDCDLQDLPEEIPKLYQAAQAGYDIVFARRVERQDSFIKRSTSAVFYKAFSYLSGVKQDGSIANFGIYSKKAIRAMLNMREPMRVFPPMIRWVGYKQTAIDVTHAPRFEGKSSYTWRKLINLALDIALSYSDKPLKLIIRSGLIISLLAFLFSIYSLIAYFTGKIKVPGYASIIISIWFLSGLIILVAGVIGLYISKIFEASKDRPIYLHDKLINFD